MNNTMNNAMNNTANNIIQNNSMTPRYNINLNVDYAGFIENNNFIQRTPYISDNTLQEITELYNAADITPYINDQNIIMDLLYQFRLYNLRLYELRNYIVNGREFSDMPVLVNENDYNQNNNVLNEYQTISPPETYTFYNSLPNNTNNIQRNIGTRYENINNRVGMRRDRNIEINYDELNEDQKLIDEMEICLEFRINNENYLKFVNNSIKKNNKQKMQIIKRTKKDKIYKNNLLINMKDKRQNYSKKM